MQRFSFGTKFRTCGKFQELLPQVQRANWKKLQSFRQKRRPLVMKLRDLDNNLQQQVGRQTVVGF
jgi:hypothetical protein